MNFETFFKACGEHDPRPYQAALATSDWPKTLIIPTGFGGIASTWAPAANKIPESRRHDARIPHR